MTVALTFTGIALVIAGLSLDRPEPLLWGAGVGCLLLAFWLSLTYPERAAKRARNRRGGWLDGR